MAGLSLNIGTSVVISCAGLGSRMETINSQIHKTLLSFKNAPIIWHLISRIPSNIQITILLGHKADQVKDFISVAFPDRDIQYEEVADFTSENSGTAKSLLTLEKKIYQSFWYFPCDAFVGEEITTRIIKCPLENTIYVAPKESVINPDDFTVVTEKQRKLSFFQYKGDTSHLDEIKIFTGIMYVKEWQTFLQLLRKNNYREFVEAFNSDFEVEELESWRDLGSPDEYSKQLKIHNKYDFSKPHEITYVLPNKVIKFFSDREEAKRKEIKPRNLPTVFPKNIGSKGHFSFYDRVDGYSLYQAINPQSLSDFLLWCKNELWKPAHVSVEKECAYFYEIKTTERVNAIKRLLPYDFLRSYQVNNKQVESAAIEISALDLKSLSKKTRASIIHGDLQFDNVIVSAAGEFRLIDWRTTFGNSLLFGDTHYDLAKILGGIEMNYLRIRNGEFAFSLDGNEVHYEFPAADSSSLLTEVLREFCEQEGFSWNKVNSLVNVIYLNMCPLHTRPFSDLLFFHFLYRAKSQRISS